MSVLNKYLALIIFLLTLVACEKYTYDPPKVADDVKFTADIQPIFDNKCVSCHDGSPKPDLTLGKSYNALKNGNYFNVTTPEESNLYLKLTTSASHIPKATDLEKATILQWIKLGANND
jgi:hypothetical protein